MELMDPWVILLPEKLKVTDLASIVADKSLYPSM